MRWRQQIASHLNPQKRDVSPLLDTEQVLRAEAAAIHGKDLSGKEGPELYRALNALNSFALCLSGGGIRSATFALGVIQALARHPRSVDGADVENAQSSLLSRVHYLSTVSGGGYTGSWLSAWCARNPFETVWQNLVCRPAGPEVEPSPIAWLRSYSNYLTPRLGLMSADSWTVLSIYLRNLFLNWLIILPALCSAILALRLIVVFLHGYGQYVQSYPLQMIGLVAGSFFLLLAVSYTTKSRPSRQLGPPAPAGTPRVQSSQIAFLRNGLSWSVLSAIGFAEFLGSDKIGDWFETHDRPDHLQHNLLTKLLVPRFPFLEIVVGAALFGAFLYGLGWILGRPKNREFRDLLLWTASGLVYGALVGAGYYFYLLLPEEIPYADPSLIVRLLFSATSYLTVGVSWILLAQWLAETIFVGMINSDVDQEWFGRGAGWLLVAAMSWFILMFLTFGGFVEVDSSFFRTLEYLVLPIMAVTGIVAAVAGGGNLSGFNLEAPGMWVLLRNFLLIASAALFFIALIFGVTIGLDRLLFGKPLFNLDLLGLLPPTPGVNQTGQEMMAWLGITLRLAIALGVMAVVAALASRYININRFSLHALYRNRLVRAFLGASRDRTPDDFSGFDPADDIALHLLRSPEQQEPPASWRPFQVINMTLNVVSSKRLSWQERKAAPFLATPLHCGTSITMDIAQPDGAVGRSVGAYRLAENYGGPAGFSLGTAMAISGAAASPNMGYHSSPAITFLLTMLNVRLGWWLGNPGRATYADEGPRTAIFPLLLETLGLTTENNDYVYLSDGGHFDNLGIYEMVRRRCRFIVVSDAGCDPKYTFEDLGNAVRKIAIDLGVDIRFRSLEKLKGRPLDKTDLGEEHDYFAIGDIDYKSADGGEVENGHILYIKAGYHGIESAGIRSYAIANPDFPHQGTANQWFSESQLESYRSLGFEIVDKIFNRALKSKKYADGHSLDSLFEALSGDGTVALTSVAVTPAASAVNPG